MSERYSRLFALSSPLYAVGAPVVITAGALLKDNQTGKVLAQLKIQNISDKAVKAATVKVEPLDTIGGPLGEPVDFQYLDLNVARDMEFGQKTPIVLPDAATRGFRVSVSDAFFVDNTAWATSGEPWERISTPLPLEQILSDTELAVQYRIEYGENCKFAFKEEKDLWWCPCGALNHKSEPCCHKCRKEFSALAAFDLSKLKENQNQRVEKEKVEALRRAEEKKTAAKARAARIKKWTMIAVPAAVIVIVAGVLITDSVKKNTSYQEAVAFIESGDYDAAISAFQALGDYKDSAEQILAVKYTQALALMEDAEYIDAATLFEELGDYKDSPAQVENALLAKYQNASSMIERRNYEGAYQEFSELGDYRDSKDIAQQLRKELDVYEILQGDTWYSIKADNIELIMEVINTPQYITFDEEIVEQVNLVAPYIDRWTYLSGDARVCSMYWMELRSVYPEDNKYSRYYDVFTIYTGFTEFGETSDSPPTLFVKCDLPIFNDVSLVGGPFELGKRIVDDFWFGLQPSELTGFYPSVQYGYIEFTSNDTLLISVEREDGSTAYCEYQRA